MNSGTNQVPVSEMRRLVVLWGACCISPILYLGAAAILRGSFMDGGGFFPMQPDLWKTVLIGLAGYIIVLQVAHIVVKHRYKKPLRQTVSDTDAFIKLLTRRTMILIGLSELAVFAGFCLFLSQGDITPVFGGGIGAMLLYAQSHPRSASGGDNWLKKKL